MWNRRQGVHDLSTIGIAQEVVGRVVKGRSTFEVAGPILNGNHIPGFPVSFDGVLVNRGVDHAQIVQDSGGLRAFAGPEEAGRESTRLNSSNSSNSYAFFRLKTGTLH